MLAACAPLARWIDVFCERGAFDAEQSRAVLEAGRNAGLGHAGPRQPAGPGPGARLAVELGAASVDHCTYLDDADIEALAAGETVATFLPGDRLLDPAAVSRRAPRARRGRLGRDRYQHEPRLEQHDVDELLHRPGGPRPADDGRGGRGGGDPRRGAGAAPRRRRPPLAGRSRRRADPGRRPATPISSTAPGCRWWPRRWSPAGSSQPARRDQKRTYSRWWPTPPSSARRTPSGMPSCANSSS